MNRSNAVPAWDPRDDRAASSAVTGIRLAELLGRLSLAFDIANGWPYGRSVRSVVLAVELGRRAGATDEELHDTFWASLLGQLGCPGVARDELAEMVGAGPRVLTALCQRREGPGPPDDDDD